MDQPVLDGDLSHSLEIWIGPGGSKRFREKIIREEKRFGTEERTSMFLGLVNLFISPFGSEGFWTLYFGTGVALFTGFLAAIPAALYETAFYLARARIVRHEIPPPMTQQPGKPSW